MRALILAAGRGERMGDLTKTTPKSLLPVANHKLIEFALANVKRAGIKEVVINVFYLAEQIKSALGDGRRYGLDIVYSEETEKLEVGGGIIHALPLLGDQPFIVVSSDVITDFALASLPKEPKGLAHLILVDNPPFHPEGDFGLRDDRVDLMAKPAFNYAGVGIYRKELFATKAKGYAKWSEFIFPSIKQGEITGAHYQGMWFNIGTPQDLEQVNKINSLSRAAF